MIWDEMAKRYAVLALLVFSLSAFQLIYIATRLGIHQPGSIVITTLATTGPDFKVVFGRSFLAAQMPDSLERIDVSGIMVAANGSDGLADFLQNNHLAFGDFFVITPLFVGVELSDSDAYHPLVTINGWYRIGELNLWAMVLSEFIGIGLFWFLYKKYKSGQNRK